MVAGNLAFLDSAMHARIMRHVFVRRRLHRGRALARILKLPIIFERVPTIKKTAAERD